MLQKRIIKEKSFLEIVFMSVNKIVFEFCLFHSVDSQVE